MKKLFTSFLTATGLLLVGSCWTLVLTSCGGGGSSPPPPAPASTVTATETIAIVGPDGSPLENATITYPCTTGGGLFGGGNCTPPAVNLPAPPAPAPTST